MSRSLGFPGLCLCCLILAPTASFAKAANSPPTPSLGSPPAEQAAAVPQGIAQDTIWVADWKFDGPSQTCNPSGWVAGAGWPRDESNHWSVDVHYAGQGFIQNHAAELREVNACWVHDGYGNVWDQSIIVQYRGPNARLSFDFLSDSEPNYDLVKVEADSLCRPNPGPDSLRQVLFETSGLNPNGRVTSLALPDFGAPDSTHCVFIRFVSDGGYSDEDGLYPTAFSAGLVVDHIAVTGGLAYTEDFEGLGIDPHIALVCSAPDLSGALYARLQHHPPDTDPAGEDTTCAWMFSDPASNCLPDLLPCVTHGIYNHITSPWVLLAPGETPTTLSWREWPGQPNLQIVLGWWVRVLDRVPNRLTPALDDSLDCPGPWQHTSNWGTLISTTWRTRSVDLTLYVPANSRAIQVRFVVSDWAYIQGWPPQPTGAGPYIDRVRLSWLWVPTSTPPGEPTAVPAVTVLHPNVPNPFNPSTTIRFDLAQLGPVQLGVYDVAGRRVRLLLDAIRPAGYGQTVTWDGRDGTGRSLPSGVYFCRLQSRDAIATRRLVLLQ